jgi:hypothetical protein
MDKYREHLASTELVNKTFSRYGATLSADPPPNFGDEVRTILLCSNNPNHHFVTDTDLGAVEEAKKWRASMHESLLADAEVWRDPKDCGDRTDRSAASRVRSFVDGYCAKSCPTSWGSIFVLNDAREPLSLRMECLLELVARRGTDQPISVLYDDLTGIEQDLAEWRIDDNRAACQNAEKGVLGGSEPTAMDLTAPPTSNSASHEDPACL